MRLAVVTVLAVFGMIAVAGDAAAESLWTIEVNRAFGVRDVESRNIGAFAKWQSVLQHAREDDERGAVSCKSSQADATCELRRQRAEFLNGARGLTTIEQVAAVHAYVNRVRWVDDLRNYGVSDRWAAPDEFFARGGDCEDYAFAKYDALKRLGVPADTMRILVLNDLKLRQPHAVLLVLVDGRLWSLDNNLRAILPADAIRHYEPIYSINESGWWLHGGGGRDVASAGRRR